MSIICTYCNVEFDIWISTINFNIFDLESLIWSTIRRKCKRNDAICFALNKPTDVNECAPVNPCAHICIDKPIGYECLCNAGFKINAKDSHLCSDIDECVEQKPCSQLCRNTFGSYSCSCADGYIPLHDGHSCKTNSSNIHFSIMIPNLCNNRSVNLNRCC